MSRSRSRSASSRRRARRPFSGMGPAAGAALAAMAAALGDVTLPAHNRRAVRMALCFRPKGGRVGDHAYRIEDVSLFALSHRLCDRGSGDVRRRLAVAEYALRLDAAVGRVVAEPVKVRDAGLSRDDGGAEAIDPAAETTFAQMACALCRSAADAAPADLLPMPALPPIYYAFDPARPPHFEDRASKVEWARAERRIGAMRAWPAAMFARGPAERFDRHPVDGSPDPWACGAAAPGAAAHAGWVLRDGVATPAAQRPDAVYVYLDGLRGWAARNPAHDALVALGLVPPRPAYAAWRESLGRYGDARGFAPHDPDREGTATNRLRALIDPLVEPDDGSLAATAAVVLDRCRALNIPVEGDPEAFALRLLEAPWRPVPVAEAPAVQVIRLTGAPAPETMVLERPHFAADLYDLGRAYAQLPAPRVAELLDQHTRRPPCRAAVPTA